MWEKAVVTWKPVMGTFPQEEVRVLPFYLPILSARREGAGEKKSQREL